MKKENLFSRLVSFLLLVISIVALIYVFQIYKERDFNGFARAEKSPYTSEFLRNKEITTNEKASYMIKSEKFNDAMLFKTINVTKQTPYKVTCMVKTENIQTEESNLGGGAQLAIEGTTERSKAIRGTNDWTKLELYFNSGNRDTVSIGLRLGGYDNTCIGTAWFSELTFESGALDTSNEWNFVCFIFKNMDVKITENGIQKRCQVSMDNDDISIIQSNMYRFKNTCEEFSKYKMKINYDIIEISDPITSISYDEANKYYINPTDVENLIEKHMKNKEYDHIFAAIRMGDAAKNIEIPVKDWIGLGSMDYHNIGFSNIRMSNDRNSYIYRYSENINQFPEEVFLHEFLHSLERVQMEYGYEIPELHDSKKYGYEDERLIGLSKWYRDYMQKNINSSGTKIGLDPSAYTQKPVQESDFKYSYKMDIENEPENIIEEIRSIASNLFNVFSRIKEVGLSNVINVN